MTQKRKPGGGRRAEQFPNAGGVIARLAYARARTAGIALDPLLKKSGLSHRQMDDPDELIRVHDQIRFLNLAAAALEDDLLGFHLAQTSDLRSFSVLYYIPASSEVLIDALQREARYSAVVNEGIALNCIDGKHVGLSFRYTGVSRHLDRHQIEFWMTALVRVCRQLTGLHLLPSRVRFTHRRPQNNSEFTQFFGTNVEFGAAVDDLAFPSRVKHLPIVSADPYLNKLLVAYCEKAISRRHKSLSLFRHRVENAVVVLLPHGKAQAGEVARQLGCSGRTLVRRLATEGVTFTEVLESLRIDLVQSYLADRSLAISQIAWLLGYREHGSFSHAFKRWTGKTPRQGRLGKANYPRRTKLQRLH
jgi:AraC-like DNA-binding protein